MREQETLFHITALTLGTSFKEWLPSAFYDRGKYDSGESTKARKCEDQNCSTLLFLPNHWLELVIYSQKQQSWERYSIVCLSCGKVANSGDQHSELLEIFPRGDPWFGTDRRYKQWGRVEEKTFQTHFMENYECKVYPRNPEDIRSGAQGEGWDILSVELLVSFTWQLGIYPSAPCRQQTSLSSTMLGMLKREMSRRIWGELYWAHDFPGRGLQSAALSLHCLWYLG